MDSISFLSHSDLAEYMHSKAHEGKIVTCVLFYDDARQLIKELACIDDTNIKNVEVHEQLYDGYDKEFYVTIDDELDIWASRAYHESDDGFKGYYKFGDNGVIALIGSDANSKLIKAADGSDYIAETSIDADALNEFRWCLSNEQIDDLKDIIEFLFEHINGE